MRVVVTGGCGFIGSGFVRLLLAARPTWQVINLDLLTYSGYPANLADVDHLPHYQFIQGDVADPAMVRSALRDAQAVVHFAAESHVDRSIVDSGPFVRTNVIGTQVLLDAARAAGIERFVQISTDEVYGALGPGDPPFTEATPLAPRNPYAATKAGADCLALAYYETHGLPVMVTRCPNNYGPRQFPEKLIPLMILNALAGETLPVYGDGRQVRDWIHVEDHNRAVLRVLEAGTPGRIYHVGAENEQFNIDVVRMILRHLGKDEGLIRYVTDRPGHDRRYAMALGALRDELGWRPEIDFAKGLAQTIDWYRANADWVAGARENSSHQAWLGRNYEGRGPA